MQEKTVKLKKKVLCWKIIRQRNPHDATEFIWCSPSVAWHGAQS